MQASTSARDLYQELFPDAPRLGMLVSFFQNVVGSLAVDPASN